MHPYVHCSAFTRAKIWKQPKCPSVDEWVKKPWGGGVGASALTGFWCLRSAAAGRPGPDTQTLELALAEEYGGAIEH